MMDKKVFCQRDKVNRRNLPPAELKLWAELHGKQLDGLHFRRPPPIPPYIVDFYFPSHRMVIEVDRDTHDPDSVYEVRRAKFVEQHEYEVLRFTNQDVHQDLAGVLECILPFCLECKETSTYPLPEESQSEE